MLKENQKVIVKWNPYSQKYYQSKGYKFTKRGDEFLVDVKDLQKGSHAKVVVICDYCGKEYSKIYKDYFTQHNGGDCCVECEGKKSLKMIEEKYGKGHRGRTLKQITQERYGVENAAQSEIIKNRIKKTNIDKYGVSTCLVLPENREKMLASFSNPETMEKRKITNLQKYGYEYGLSSPVIREKIVHTLSKNGTVPTSNQQIELFNLLSQYYNPCFLNYPCGRRSLDCVIEPQGIKIDIEYDGRYWHSLKADSDKKRDEYVQSKGYKIFRIVGSYKIPTIEELQRQIDILLTTDAQFVSVEVE